ncbi:MAG: triose-phosphate isomerase [Hyphomicrobiales bacterium]|nr:triose-phosphate isomerase [Hyphomicrobiales bacterium]
MVKSSRTRPLLVGNWKMNGLRASEAEISALAEGLGGAQADVWLCPPVTLLSHFIGVFKDAPLSWGAQDCHAQESGAHTGDVSAEMLADIGAVSVIVGHSERRRDHAETNAIVRSKLSAVQRAGMVAIVCIGETLEERERGDVIPVLEKQLRESLPEDVDGSKTVLAYEPVWAIGTGKVPSSGEIVEVHGFLRDRLDARGIGGVPVLYGGSLGPGNADWLLRLDHVDGGLIGSASLKASSFLGVIRACQQG